MTSALSSYKVMERNVGQIRLQCKACGRHQSPKCFQMLHILNYDGPLVTTSLLADSSCTALPADEANNASEDAEEDCQPPVAAFSLGCRLTASQNEPQIHDRSLQGLLILSILEQRPHPVYDQLELGLGSDLEGMPPCKDEDLRGRG